VEYGILPEKEAEQLYKKILKRKGKSPGASVSSPSPVKTKKKKTKILEDDVEPDMQVSSGDGIGRVALGEFERAGASDRDAMLGKGYQV
jgi:hypothetical protein